MAFLEAHRLRHLIFSLIAETTGEKIVGGVFIIARGWIQAGTPKPTRIPGVGEGTKDGISSSAG
jgi:hypothetical protein